VFDRPLDTLATFHSTNKITTTTTGAPPPAPVRYAVRQVLDQEHRNELLRLRSVSRLARGASHSLGYNELPASSGAADDDADDDKENSTLGNDSRKKKQANNTAMIIGGGKRDFFGRIIVNEAARPGSAGGKEMGVGGGVGSAKRVAAEERVWVSFHEGYSNAVRKPVTLREFLGSF
jgi:chromosome transmission fidelity protein 18